MNDHHPAAVGRSNEQATPIRFHLGEISPAPDNLLNRDFSAGAPNEKWPTDISEFRIPAGKVYLSPMIDCFDGMAVSGSIGMRSSAECADQDLTRLPQPRSAP